MLSSMGKTQKWFQNTVDCNQMLALFPNSFNGTVGSVQIAIINSDQFTENVS